jgi:2-(1,2-epoxy-1,2-dihydrophenyl)acetyl-CoA isomerase
MTGQLNETRDGAVAVLTMNRPEARNALTGEILEGLTSAVTRLAADASVRAIVLTGAGGAFCAGGDVKGFAERNKAMASGGGGGFDMEARVWGLRSGMEVCRLLREAPKPTLAIIPGPAAGAGLSLALACDLRICAEEAKLTTAFAKVGLAGDYGGSYFLTHLVGAAKARELYFTADVITGAEALRLGVVNRTAPTAQIMEAGMAWARELAALPTLALGYMKKNLNAAEHATLGEVLDLEAQHMVRTMMTEDHKAAAAAFVAKAKPVFQGR